MKREQQLIQFRRQILNFVGQYKSKLKPKIKAFSDSDEFKALMGHESQHYQLTKVDVRILLTLENGRAETKSQLADRLVHEPACLTRSLERMMEHELVAKFVDQTDKRFVRITLTDRGKKVAHLLRKEIESVWADVCEDFSQKDISTLTELLEPYLNQ